MLAVTRHRHTHHRMLDTLQFNVHSESDGTLRLCPSCLEVEPSTGERGGPGVSRVRTREKSAICARRQVEYLLGLKVARRHVVEATDT